MTTTTDSAVTELWNQTSWFILASSIREASNKIAARGLVRLLLGMVFPMFLIFAQVVPFYMRSLLDKIEPQLPNVTDAQDLKMLETLFLLYYHGLKDVYRPYCLFRGRMDAVIADFDDYLDDFDMIRSGELGELAESVERWIAAERGAA